ncbi:MAG: hypothetical protein FH748_10600 [Balneolaceae bacterium]|nr:hypothetical protein [Balneolaceae bacterium]
MGKIKVTKRKLKKENKTPSHSESAAKLLPAKISGIQLQKKNKNRFSLFVEDQFLIGVSDSVLTKHHLSKGVEITPFLLDQIIKDEENWAAREYMFRLLGRRIHSKQELKTKALKKGFSADYLDDIILELENKDYVNDLEFAHKYAADKFKFNNWGPYKIKAYLFKKGIHKATIEQALNSVFAPDKVESTLRKLVLKKKSRFLRTAEEKRSKKLFDFLMRKGYDSDSILRQLDKLLELIKK